MSLNEVIKYKSSAGDPIDSDIPNGGFVTSKDGKRIYGKSNDTLIPLANKDEIAPLPFSGYIGRPKPNTFGTTPYKLQDNSKFVNFDGNILEFPSGTEIDMTDNMPEVQVQDQATNGLVVQSSVNAGDYVVVDKIIETYTQPSSATNTNAVYVAIDNIYVVGTKIVVKNNTTNTTLFTSTITQLDGNNIRVDKNYDRTADEYEIQLASDVYRAERDTADMYDYLDTDGVVNLVTGDIIKSTGVNPNSISGHYYKWVYSNSNQDLENYAPLNNTTYAKDIGTAENMSLLNPYFQDRTKYGITNKILATMKEDGTIKTEVCFVDTAIEHCKNAHRVMTDNGYIRSDDKKGLYTKDGDIVTPLGTWSTLNKGAYHPVFNYFGAKRVDSISGTGTSLWHSSDGDRIFNTADSWLYGTYNYGSITFGYSGRPDSKFYDIIYPDQWIDLRIEAIAVSECDLLNRVGTKAKSGQLDGIGGVLATIYAVARTTTDDIRVTNFNGTGNLRVAVKNTLNPVQITNVTTPYEVTISVYGKEVKAIIGNSTSDATSTYFQFYLVDRISEFPTTWTDANSHFSITKTLPHPSSGTALRPEILANPDRYSDDMKSILASGNPLMFTPNLVDDTGASNIPTGTDGTDGKATFKLNNKFTTAHQVLKSTDKGVNWSPLALTTHYTVDTVTNSITFTSGNIPLASDMIMISNTAKIPTTQVSDPKAVKLVGNYVTATNSHSIYKGNQLVPTGKVNVGNGSNGLESRVVENTASGYTYLSTNKSAPTVTVDETVVKVADGHTAGGIVGGYYLRQYTNQTNYDLSVQDYSNTTTWKFLGTQSSTPTHSTIALDDSNSPAVKFIETIAEDEDGMAHYQVFAQEMVSQGGVYGGDDNQFTQLTNGTKDDDNANTVKTIVASRPLNKYIGVK
jgi:hypothetical protein